MTCCVIAPPGRRTAAVVVASTGTVTGTVVDGSAVAVPGGTIELLLLGAAYATAIPNGSGVYTFSNVPVGSYTIQQQPPLAYSIGPSESDSYSISVSGGATTTQNFVVQSAIYSDNFSTYSTDGNFTHTGGAFVTGDFFKAAPNGQAQVTIASANPSRNQFAGAIVCDLTGGFTGGPSMRYDFPAQPANCNFATPSDSDWTTASQPRMSTYDIGSNPNMWWRVSQKVSASWEHGASASTNARAYKFLEFTLDKESPPFSNNSRFGIYLFDGSPTPLGTNVYCDWSDRVSGTSNFISGSPGQVTALGSTYGGTYDTWVIGALGMGTSSGTFKLYRNGVLISTLSQTYFNGITDAAITFALGANINNGPDDAQSRWFCEMGVYKSRPSLIPITG